MAIHGSMSHQAKPLRLGRRWPGHDLKGPIRAQGQNVYDEPPGEHKVRVNMMEIYREKAWKCSGHRTQKYINLMNIQWEYDGGIYDGMVG